MSVKTFQITSNSTVCLTACLGQQRMKHQRYVLLAILTGKPLVTCWVPLQKGNDVVHALKLGVGKQSRCWRLAIIQMNQYRKFNFSSNLNYLNSIWLKVITGYTKSKNSLDDEVKSVALSLYMNITEPLHDDVIKWKHFPRYWPFVRGIHRSPMNTAQIPVTWSFDIFFDLILNKRLSKQSWGWWFETPSCLLWRHCNVIKINKFRLKNLRFNLSLVKCLSFCSRANDLLTLYGGIKLGQYWFWIHVN